MSIILASCTKQSVPSFNDSVSRGQAEQQRLDACTNANFNQGILLYQNVLLIFKCTKWDQQFPNLYSSITKTSAASWNQVFGPINESFMDNLQRRNRMFKNIRDLDSKKGLDSLSYVLVALNETNFFDSTKTMFKCVENPAEDLCKNRKNIPSRKSLKNIIRLVDLNPEAVGELSALLKHLNLALEPTKEQLRAEVNKFRFAGKFIPLRLNLVDSLALKAKSGLSTEDRTFLNTILTVTTKNNEVPWIYQWLKDEKLGRIKFRDLIEYPALTNPDTVHDIRAVKQLYNLGFSCTYVDKTTPNNSIEFDLNAGIGDYVSVIKSKDYKSFYDLSAMHITGLMAASQFCIELTNNQYQANLIKIAARVAEFFSEKKNYDLIKYILNYSTSKSDTHKSFEENIYFADFIASDIFNAVNGVNGHISTYSRDFYPVVYDIIVNLPPEAVLNLANVVSELTKIENDSKFIGVSDFWLFFNNEEKNFVFNFVDRHFDRNIEYVLLFDFYSKFLDEFKDAQPVLRNGWMGTDEKVEDTYLAIEDLFNNMSGKETLQDFKKFFSRDQIIRILEVISNGQKLADDARAELKYRDSSQYILLSKSEKYKYNVSYDPGSDNSYDAKVVLQCMQYFSNIQNGFYDLVRNLPEACKAVTKDNLAFSVYGWLDSIEHDFLNFKPTNNQNDSLLDNKGIFSPFMLNTDVALAKNLDNIIGPYPAAGKTQNGLAYALDSINFYLNTKNGIQEIEKDLGLVSRFFDVKKEDNVIFRNALIKNYADSHQDHFSFTTKIFADISNLLIDYGKWIQSGNYKKTQQRSLGKYDPNFECSKINNQFISVYACPSKQTVKDFGNKILFYLSNIWEKEQGSPIQLFMHAVKLGDGLEIPLNSHSNRFYRVSMEETLRYLYDTTDRSMRVNNQNLLYINEQNQSAVQNVTVLERIETVIREVRFGNNYLGVSYLNHVVEGNDYNKDVNERRTLIRSCVKIPKIRCGRVMSDNDLRMAKNAVESFDSLLDVNNGLGFDSKLKYGDYLKTVQQALVGSSAKDAQALTVMPLSDEVLQKHNGVILSYLTLMNGFSNSARFVRDRIGRTRTEFEKFMAREDFKRVDRALLVDFDLYQATPSAERLLRKMLIKPNGEKENLYEATVDWLSALSYDELRLVEDAAARLLVVGSYLGKPEIVFNDKLQYIGYEKYEKNNLYLIFMAMEKIIDYWPTLKHFFPGDVKLIEVIRPIDNFLYYLTEKLNSTTVPSKNTVYLALNDIFYVLQSVMLEPVQDSRIFAKSTLSYSGLDFVLSGLKDTSLVADTLSTIRSNYIYSDAFYENQGTFFMSLGQNLGKVSANPTIDLIPIREYLNYTSKDVDCRGGDSVCMSNYHYDEIATLIKYLVTKDKTGTTNLMLVNKKIFIENYSQLIEMINELLPAIKVKTINMPLMP